MQTALPGSLAVHNPCRFADLEQGEIVEAVALFISAEDVAMQACASSAAWRARTTDRKLHAYNVALNILASGGWEFDRVSIPRIRSLDLTGTITDVTEAMDRFVSMAEYGWLRIERICIDAMTAEETITSEEEEDHFTRSLLLFLQTLGRSISMRELMISHDLSLKQEVLQGISDALQQSHGLSKIILHFAGDRNVLQRLHTQIPTWSLQDSVLQRQPPICCSSETLQRLTRIRERVSETMQALDLMASNVHSPEGEQHLTQWLDFVASGLNAIDTDSRGSVQDPEEDELREFDIELATALWKYGWSDAGLSSIREQFGIHSPMS